MSLPKTIAVSDIAQICGVSERHIRAMVGRGELPKYAGRGKLPFFEALSKLVSHFRERGVTAANDIKAQRARLVRAQADGEELRNQRERGELVPMAEAEAELTRVLMRFREPINTQARRLAPRCNPTDPQLAYKAIDEDNRRTLNDIADWLDGHGAVEKKGKK